jgi:hypothetical protein
VEQLTPGRFYIDEDPDQGLAPLLTGIGHGAVSTNELGHKGRTDLWQLAFAARERRTLVTCNIDDFEMLHDAWASWSREWGIGQRVAHAGILLIPQRPDITLFTVISAIDELLRREDSLDYRLFRWRLSTGWVELFPGARFTAPRPSL